MLAPRVPLDRVDGPVAEQVGHIAGLPDGDIAVPQVGFVAGVAVRVVVERTGAEAPEVLVAALQRSERRQHAQVPFADQRRGITGVAQQRRQGGMFGRQSDIGLAGERFLEPQGQAVLVAAGDQREACRGTDCRVGVGLGEAHAAFGDAVDVGRREVPPAAAGKVRVAKIVGHDEHDVRAQVHLLRYMPSSHRTGARSIPITVDTPAVRCN